MKTLPKKTTTVVSNFEKIVSEAAKNRTGDPEKILESIERVTQTNPPSFTEQHLSAFLRARTKTLKILVGEYFLARMTTQYGIIDESLFEKSRYLLVEGSKVLSDSTATVDRPPKARLIRIPLFPWAYLHEKKIELGSTTAVSSNNRGWGPRTVRRTITITAKVPQVPREVEKKGRKALGVYHSILGELYTNERTSELANDRPGGDFVAELGVTWIPSPKSLSIKTTETVQEWPAKADPALLLVAGEGTFLVDTWDDEEEEPFEHFMREFTSGAYPEKS